MKNIQEKTSFNPRNLRSFQEPDWYMTKVEHVPYNVRGLTIRMLVYLDDGIRIDKTSGGCYLWNGLYWTHAGAKSIALKTIGGLVRDALYVQAARLEDDEKNNLVKWINLIDDTGGYIEKAIAKLSEFSGVVIDINQAINKNLHLINAPNGIVDLKTGEVIPHDMDLMMLGVTGIPLLPEKQLFRKSISETWAWLCEKAPKTAAFIYQTFHVEGEGGPQTQERIQYVLCVMANLMNGDTSLQKFFIMKGKGGNGKGTLDRLLLLMFGTYGKTADPLMFTSKGAARVFRQVGSFIGKRFIAIPEIPRTAQMNASFVKNWTGEDFIPYTNLYEAEAEMKPHSTLWFSINHNMHVDEYGPAMRRRLVMLFTMNRAKLVKGGENKNLVTEMIEEEGPALAAVLVRLSYSLINNEMKTPETIIEDSAEYIRKDNFIQEFFDNCTHVKLHSDEEPRMNVILTVSELYYHAKEYNKMFGSGAHGRFMNYQAFVQALEDLDGYPSIIWGAYDGDQFSRELTKGLEDFMPDIMMTEAGLNKMKQHQQSDSPTYRPGDEEPPKEATGTDEPIVNMAKRIFQEQPDLGMDDDDDK